jgi:putative hydrolase of the HAD superfamily
MTDCGVKFCYFDLGNVLLKFDHRLACRQWSELTGVPADRIWDVVFAGGLNERLDAGTLDTRGFYDLFCDEFDVQPDYAKFCHAGSAIFEVNYSMSTVLAHLAAAGHRLGVLSNTSELHYDYFADGRYWFLPGPFEHLVLSCREKLMKPDPRIYLHAAKLAGVGPAEMFYVDDIAKNVTGALEAGVDAVLYTTTPAFVADLRKRNIRFDY